MGEAGGSWLRTGGAAADPAPPAAAMGRGGGSNTNKRNSAKAVAAAVDATAAKLERGAHVSAPPTQVWFGLRRRTTPIFAAPSFFATRDNSPFAVWGAS